MRPAVTLAALVLLSIAISACGGSASGSRDIEAAQSNDRWELRLHIAGEVRSGEVIAVELSLENVSDETLRVHAGCWWFDLEVLDEKGTSVFVWSDYIIQTEYKGVLPQCPAHFTELAAGETLDKTVSFQVNEPGEYAVRPQPPTETVGIGSQPIDLSLSVRVRAK